MPWIEAQLRGQKVFAKAKADGALDASGGRVEIRYKANDGKAYRASAANLTVAPGAKVMPEETCGAAEGAGAGGSGSGSAKGSGSGAKAVHPTSSADKWIVYADGACSGNPGPAGAGFVVVMPGGKIHDGYEYLGEGTNNIAELTAILRAVEAIPQDGREVIVHTDSKYSIGVLSKGWKAKANQALIAKAKEKVVARGAKLVYVEGHAGVPLNERADELAREAVTRRRSQPVVIA